VATPKKYEHIDFKPPKSVAEAAAKGLEYRREASPSNRGGLTPEQASKEGIGSGVQRAVNLKNRDTISPETIRQMHGFFSRHEKNKGVAAENKGEPWNDKGHVAWLLWGGDPGQQWVEKIMAQMEKADEKKTADADGNYMSVKAIQALHDHARMLMDHITEGVELPDWVESKITRANSDLSDVFEHFQHKPREAALRKRVIRLARTNPALRPHLLPLLQKGGS